MLLTDLPKDEPPAPGESTIVPPALRNPKDTRAEAAAIVFPPASTLAWWKDNRVFTFYQQIPSGINQYIEAAQLSTNEALGFQLFLFSGQTYGGTSCERSVLNYFHGTLELFTAPQLWIKLPGTGVQTWKDTCDPALDHDVPLAGSYAWNVYPLDPYGLRFEFQNSNYNPYGYIANFIFRRIR
jgi:hypothetical protein